MPRKTRSTRAEMAARQTPAYDELTAAALRIVGMELARLTTVAKANPDGLSPAESRIVSNYLTSLVQLEKLAAQQAKDQDVTEMSDGDLAAAVLLLKPKMPA